MTFNFHRIQACVGNIQTKIYDVATNRESLKENALGLYFCCNGDKDKIVLMANDILFPTHIVDDDFVDVEEFWKPEEVKNLFDSKLQPIIRGGTQNVKAKKEEVQKLAITLFKMFGGTDDEVSHYSFEVVEST
ncbi:hypothetical protein N9Y92_00710 [Chlamydiales bacterium]|nr:hypothetical protein [Chlamydiales bacterium]